MFACTSRHFRPTCTPASPLRIARAHTSVLSHLPKHPGPTKALKYRRSTPGSMSTVLYPWHINFPTGPLNPAHPALRKKGMLASMPKFNCPAFQLRAMPFDILNRPEKAYPFPRSDDFGLTVRPGDKKQRPMARMSLVMLFTRVVMRSLTIRNRIRARLRTAFGIAVGRNAHKDEKGKLVLGEVPTDLTQMLLKDWCYYITPSADVYRMPMEDLVDYARKGLQAVKIAALRKEQEWAQLPDKGFSQGGQSQGNNRKSYGIKS
ncbi:hypothetical protein EXIGLDRAFT_769991 [Exidia glandulosa HHB12029]|uniref:Uncharacterized protein n=1 Tax=Exidia glandulosa HHB12029 TaxID=1314781 RepID=A0A165H295_EXIGL|nr:hypothetical protein EXIGLDRAFT_769991 [Exidia glandulosa HHB12029]